MQEIFDYDADGNLQYPCMLCDDGTVTQYPTRSACDSCTFVVRYPGGRRVP